VDRQLPQRGRIPRGALDGRRPDVGVHDARPSDAAGMPAAERAGCAIACSHSTPRVLAAVERRLHDAPAGPTNLGDLGADAIESCDGQLGGRGQLRDRDATTCSGSLILPGRPPTPRAIGTTGGRRVADGRATPWATTSLPRRTAATPIPNTAP
jgi:hypothetical protein